MELRYTQWSSGDPPGSWGGGGVGGGLRYSPNDSGDNAHHSTESHSEKFNINVHNISQYTPSPPYRSILTVHTRHIVVSFSPNFNSVH